MSASRIPGLARSSALVPLERLTRVEIVAERLAEAIQLGLFGQNDRLPVEADLADQLGVAPGTVREALSILRARGLVTTRRGRTGGTFVHVPAAMTAAYLRQRLGDMTLDELRDLADMHSATLSEATYLAAQRCSDMDAQHLRQRLRELLRPTNPAISRRAHARLYIEIAAASHSLRLTNQEMSLQAELAPLFWIVHEDRPPLGPYTDIVEAIAEHQPDRARQLIRDHLEREHATLYSGALELDQKNLSNNSSKSTTTSSPVETAAQIEQILAPVFESLDLVGEAVLAALLDARAQGRQAARADLEPARKVIREQLDRHRGLVSGAGPVFAPHVLSDAPYWLDWWCQASDGEPSILVVALDPNSPEFYDYQATEWYSTTAQTRQREVSGPSIDYSGTDQNNLTLTVPMQIEDDYLGVAGADVPLAALESTVTRVLKDMATTSALIDQHGRILASTDLRWVPGTLIVAGAAPEHRYALEHLPWSLVIARALT